MENSNSYRGSLRVYSGNRTGSSAPVRDHSINEEELYERRRQQELRRQIEAKEQELESIANNKERLGQRFGIHTWDKPQINETGSKSRFDKTPPHRLGDSRNSPLRGPGRSGSRGSPLRKKSGSPTYPTQGHPAKSILRQSSGSPTQGILRKSSGSPLRQKSGSPTRAYVPSTSHNPQSDYLLQLQNDNASLQRRLNLVLQELDRVNRDRSNLAQKFNIAEKDMIEMRRMLREEDMDDKVNRDLQMELNTQKDKNKETKLRLADLDRRRADAIQQLRILQGERDRQVNNNGDLSKDFQRKMGMSKALEDEMMRGRERVLKLNGEIDRLKRQEVQDNAHQHDVAVILGKLRNERDDLMQKLEHLNRTYDNCVQEITREKLQMDLNNKHHNKLLVAKVMFQLMEVMEQQRKQDAVNEFFTYCRFDQKCHSTLKQFVNVLERLGNYKLKIGIKQWHQKTFKPIETIEQTNQLVGKMYDSRLMTRMFNRWRLRFNQTQNMYGHKNKALVAIWEAKVKDVKKDIQRAFVIWREKANFEILRERRIKRLIWKCYFNKLSQAFRAWIADNQRIEGQVRLHVLAKCLAEDQLNQITFAQLKVATDERKRKRLNILRSYYKAWRESNKYRKYMIDQNVVVMQYRRQFNQNLLKTVFDALRQNKEEEKFILMEQALQDETVPMINSLNKEITAKANTEMRSGQTKAVNAMQQNLRTRIASYFYKWRDSNEGFKFGVGVHVKEQILRLYKFKLATAFATWKKGRDFAKITFEQGSIMMMEEEGNDLQGKVEEVNKEIQQAEQQVVRSGRSALTRAIKICNKRYLLQGMRKWKGTVDLVTKKESTIENSVIKKMRLRLVRSAFDLYKAHAKKMTQMSVNEDRSKVLAATLDLRTKRKIFNALNTFVHQFGKQQAACQKVMNRVQLLVIRRAYRTWQNQGNTKQEQLLIMEQSDQTEQMTELSKQIAGLEKVKADQNENNKGLETKLRTQANRSVANMFARGYYGGVTRGFEKWKDVVKCEKEKERIIKRMLEHWKKNNAFYLMCALKQWAKKGKISDMEYQSAQISADMNDIQIVDKGNNRKYDEATQAQKQDLAKLDKEIRIAQDRMQTVVGTMIMTNDDNNYMSKSRAVFLAWKDHTKRTVAFTKTLTHMIQNTLWHQGFQNIKEFSRDKLRTRQQNKAVVRIRKMFWKRNCGAAFSRWREKELQVAMAFMEEVGEQTNMQQEEFEKQVDRIKDNTAVKYGKKIASNEKHKLWQKWKGVTKMLKAQRMAKQNTNEAFGGYLTIRAMRKWIERVRATKFARDRVAKYHKIKDNIYRKACFRELNAKYKRNKSLCVQLSNLATKYNNTGKQSAFQMIKNFKLAKDHVHKTAKIMSTKDLGSILQKIYIRKLTNYMTDLRTQCLRELKKQTKQRNMIKHMLSRGKREAFMKWKKKSESIACVEDVNECGPVVEEVLEARLVIKNCMDFMRNEGYTPKQIDAFEEQAEKRNLDVIRRTVGHWRAFTLGEPDDTKLLPICLNRWRDYVARRKIIKHWLDFITIRNEPFRADLQKAFNKWKFHFNGKDAFLNKQHKDYIVNRCINSQKELNNIIEKEEQGEDLVTHLSQQNDELYDNYIKSTRLAFALSRDNLDHAKRKAFSTWVDNTRCKKLCQLEDVLGKNIDLISGMKNKIAEVEKDNELLANENEELRQFSLDGYQIAKNVQSLTHEREKLSVDLADKAATIKKLLDENERLSYKLRSVQENVLRISQAF